MGDSAAEHVFTPISSMDDLNDRVRTCWENFDQQITDKAIDHWRDKLKAVVRLNGGHIEQFLWLSGTFAVVLSYVAYMRSKNTRAFVLLLCIESYDGTVTKIKSSK